MRTTSDLTKWASLILAIFTPVFQGRGQTPSLSARQAEGGRIQLSWPVAEGFVLEQTSRLGAGASWTAVTGTPAAANGQNTITVPAAATELYFRLRSGAAGIVLTRVAASPANGESGISVNRETVFRFSLPLAASTTVSTNIVFAEVGSRRILSRAELASDRQKITLFYLEPLPASSRVRVRLDGSQLRDASGTLVDGDGDGAPGGWAEVRFDTMNSVLLTGTAVSGYVYDSAVQQTAAGPTNKPIAGVIITVDGLEQTGRAVTDASGFFVLNPCPAGRFFVHIDGRQAEGSTWPAGAYYPFVGKTFEGKVGQTNSIPGGVVYLPLVPAATLKSVSAQTTTEVELPASVLAGRPELVGLKVTLPPNALFADDGTRGGSVGIAAVPPDRLPAPLPLGFEPPLVITVQTDGPANFDQPVPVQFPNLPDPRTGKALAPGEKSVLWSFNHDSGQWEPQGTMTASADGKFLVSDPGVGILQPGWSTSVGVWPPVPPSPPQNTNCHPGQLAKDYLEWQLKAAECGLRMAAFLTIKPFTPQPLTTAAFQSSASMLGAMPGMITSLNNLASAVQSGSPAAAVGALAGIIVAEKAAITPLGKQLFSAPAINLNSLVGDIVKCMLEAAREQLDFSCGILPCVFGNTPRVAQQQQICSATQTGINGLLNTMTAYSFKNGGAFDRLCTALDKLVPLVNAYIAPLTVPTLLGASGQKGRLAAATLQGQILTEIQNALTAISELQTELQPTVDLRNEGLAFLNTYSNYVESVDGGLLLRFNAHANSYYKLTSGSFASRGRTTASGTMNLPGVGLTESFSFQIYDPLRNAVSDGNAPAPGIDTPRNLGTNPLYLPDPALRLPGINDLSGDTDGDGLTDLAEDVIGTRRDEKDTDGDGVNDFAEVQQGQDPLSGVALPIGPVAGLSLQGVSRAIDVSGTTAYLAQGNAGMAVVDLADPLNPLLLSQIALSGFNRDIAYSARARTAGLVAYASDAQIAQGESGQVHVVELADPTQPRLLRSFLTPASAIKENDEIFYVAAGDQVRMYDAVTGLEIGWFAVGAPVTGLLPTESDMFVTTATRLSIFDKALLSPALKGQLNGAFAAADIESSVPMVQEGNLLWIGTAAGLFAVDVSNRSAPRVLNQAGGAPRAFRTLSLSAGKRAVALTTFRANVIALGGETSVFDISDPTSNNRQNLLLNARGETHDSALMSGWLVLADQLAGLTVMNLQGFDSGGAAPSIAWVLDAQDTDPAKPGVQMVEGQDVTFRPGVTDDVEVDSTELLVDGAVVGTSRVIPPVFNYQLPVRAEGITQINVQIRSRDRSGNVGLSETVAVELVADTVAPTLLHPTAQSGFAAFSNWPIGFRFSEALLASAWQPGSMTLLSLGGDGVVGGGDDAAVPLASATVVGPSASIVPASPLGFGRYRLTIPKESIRDAASNSPPADLALEFNAFAAEPETAVWISPLPGRFLDAANWLHARVPNQADVLIQLPGATPTVTLDGRATVKTLTVAGALAGTNRFASLNVTRSAQFIGPVQWIAGSISFLNSGESREAVFEQTLSLSGAATLSAQGRIETRGLLSLNGGASFTLDGAAAQFVASGGIETMNATFAVRGGAALELPQFTTLNSPGDFVPLIPVAATFRSQGAGSRLTLPNLTSANGPTTSNVRGAPSLRFEATSGGELQLPRLTALTGRTALVSDGSGSVLNAPVLASDVGPDTPIKSVIDAANQGRVQVPALTVAENVTITERTGGVVARGTP